MIVGAVKELKQTNPWLFVVSLWISELSFRINITSRRFLFFRTLVAAKSRAPTFHSELLAILGRTGLRGETWWNCWYVQGFAGGTSFCIALCQQVKFATGEFWIWKHRVSLERDQAARINLWTLAGWPSCYSEQTKYSDSYILHWKKDPEMKYRTRHRVGFHNVCILCLHHLRIYMVYHQI